MRGAGRKGHQPQGRHAEAGWVWPVAARRFAGIGIAAIWLGCAGTAPAADAPARTASAGLPASPGEPAPVRVTAELTPSPARVSDDLSLTVTAESLPAVNIEGCEVRIAPADFVVRQSRQAPARIDNDRQIVQWIYTLEPVRTGRLSIQPAEVRFVQGRPGQTPSGAEGGRGHQTARSGPIDVEVRSVVPETASLEMLRGPAGPVGLPSSASERTAPGFSRTFAAAALGAVAGLAALAVLGVWLRARWRAIPATSVPSPREEALRGLEEVLRQGPEGQDVRWFYRELATVVRRYLARTTGIRALEQTTEESLREVADRGRLPRDAAAALRVLLEAADLVKFAAYRPGPGEIDEHVAVARSLVESPWGEAGG